MRVFTQSDFDALPVVDGIRQCPCGDYTAVRSFGPDCRFGANCRFGPDCDFGGCCCFGDFCLFGSNCNFAPDCRFGSLCNFGPDCSFGAKCDFASYCSFRTGSDFGANCDFASYCSFGPDCNFAPDCRFGPDCRFAPGCSFEGHLAKPGYPLLAIAGAGSENRTTYFFNTVDGIIVRSGCFKGTLAQFRNRVRADDARTPNKAKTLQYLGMANIAAATWDCTQIEA